MEILPTVADPWQKIPTKVQQSIHNDMLPNNIANEEKENIVTSTELHEDGSNDQVQKEKKIVKYNLR